MLSVERGLVIRILPWGVFTFRHTRDHETSWRLDFADAVFGFSFHSEVARE